MKTVIISGFGGAYENECQRMFKTGLQFLEDHKEELKTGPLSFKKYKNIYGIIEPMSSLAKQLEAKILLEHKGCSGAMFQAVVGLLVYVARNSMEKLLEEVAKHNPKRIFEWDGTEVSCLEMK